jgi:hypothetical protein
MDTSIYRQARRLLLISLLVAFSVGVSIGFLLQDPGAIVISLWTLGVGSVLLFVLSVIIVSVEASLEAIGNRRGQDGQD